MITNPTVLILGAGASMMYGFPSGLQLRQLILQKYSDDPHAVRVKYSELGLNPNEVSKFFQSFNQSGVTSIDAFLEHRREYIQIGKTAIAENLIPFEDEFTLFGRENDWYSYLLDKLNAPLEVFNRNRLTVLTFNYDRSLEYYFYAALQNRYGVGGERVLELLSSVPIIHLHGTLGGLPWTAQGRRYYPSTEANEIILGRDQIKVIHEDLGADEQFRCAFDALGQAQRIIFLGFGYNKTNLQRLRHENWYTACVVYGSNFGMTVLETKAVRTRMLGNRNVSFGKPEWDVLRFLREIVDLEA